VNLDELADALTSAAPDLDPAGQRLFIATYRLLAAGLPVTAAQLAAATGLPEETVAGVLTYTEAYLAALEQLAPEAACAGSAQPPGRQRQLDSAWALSCWHAPNLNPLNPPRWPGPAVGGA
jgi:hypothetical protein